MISYCIAAYRPKLCKLLVEDLPRKTTVPYEILVWNNTGDIGFENFLVEQSRAGVKVNIIGSTPENIGMAGYKHLFKAAKYPLVVQIDDDVVCVSRRIAEICTGIFGRNPTVRQVVSDLWQDEYTWGNKPPGNQYRWWKESEGLMGGPVDGWFNVVHRDVIPLILEKVKFGRYFSLGIEIRRTLEKAGLVGLLCTKFKVFHVVGGPYLSYYGMIEEEAKKWGMLSGKGVSTDWIAKMTKGLPSRSTLERKIQHIHAELDALGRP